MNGPLPEIPVPRTALQRRLVHLASRRSMAEMERILHRFLVNELTILDEVQCQVWIGLLDHADADLLDWMAGIKPLPDGVDPTILSQLSVHARESTGV
ncbi:MAG: succinate dehydrogenase assembly factor 2 [Magnetococcales bacterium]|nr:succinate dehydrogenase assembly factor 2 [Magnetococcales bacterium]